MYGGRAADGGVAVLQFTGGTFGLEVIALLQLADGDLVVHGVALLPYIAGEGALHCVFGVIAGLYGALGVNELDLQLGPGGQRLGNHELHLAAVDVGAVVLRRDGVVGGGGQSVPHAPGIRGRVVAGGMIDPLGIDAHQADFLNQDVIGDGALGEADCRGDMVEVQGDELVVQTQVLLLGVGGDRARRSAGDGDDLRLAVEHVLQLGGLLGQGVGEGGGGGVIDGSRCRDVDGLQRGGDGVEPHVVALLVGPLHGVAPVAHLGQQDLVEECDVGWCLVCIAPDGQRVMEVGDVIHHLVGRGAASGRAALSRAPGLSGAPGLPGRACLSGITGLPRVSGGL